MSVDSQDFAKLIQIGDLAVAGRLGMRTILYAADQTGFDASKDDVQNAELRPDRLITDLNQLREILRIDMDRFARRNTGQFHPSETILEQGFRRLRQSRNPLSSADFHRYLWVWLHARLVGRKWLGRGTRRKYKRGFWFHEAA